jgi:hypothetical protein
MRVAGGSSGGAGGVVQFPILRKARADNSTPRFLDANRLPDNSARFPRLVKRSIFRANVAKIESDTCRVALIFRSVNDESQTNHDYDVCIVVHQNLVSITIADFYAILGEGSDLRILLKNGVVESFVFIKRKRIVAAFAKKNASPKLFTPEMVDPAVRKLDIILGAK